MTEEQKLILSIIFFIVSAIALIIVLIYTKKVVKGEKVTGNMESFVEKITPSINKNGTVDDAIHNNIDSVVKEVSEDESIKLLIDQGKVKVIGAYYDLGGKVTFYE